MFKLSFLFTFFLLSATLLKAGGSVWPGVKYSYAVVYLYNVDGGLAGNHQILKDGKLDKTVVGEGKKLATGITAELDKIFGSGPAIDELVNGLSGCYIPRHAIVYYNSKDKPIASMSICFECEGIRFYSPSYPRNSYASSPELVTEAQEKLKEIKAIIESVGIKTDFKMEENKKPEVKNEGSIHFTDSRAIDSLFPEKITLKNYRTFFTDTLDIKVREDEKFTYGGDKYIFVDVYKGNSHLYFSGSDENSSLESASVSWNDVVLCNKIKIGMTLEEVQNFLPVYDGISNPEILSIQNEDGSKKITFKFFEDKLMMYEMEVRVW